MDKGRTVIDLAKEWGFRTTDSVYRIKRFRYVPPASTLQKMAETFGWTAGETLEHWIDQHQLFTRRAPRAKEVRR